MSRFRWNARRLVWVAGGTFVGMILVGGGVALGLGLHSPVHATSANGATPKAEDAGAFGPDPSSEFRSQIEGAEPVAPAPSTADAEPSSPTTEPTPMPAEPQAPARETPTVSCPSGALIGTVVSATAAPGGYEGEVLTVHGIVQNQSTGDILMLRSDTPDVVGYDATGGVQLIQLYGSWDNTARDSFLLAPSASIGYTTTINASAEQLRKTIALYSAAEVGSVLAVWNDGAYAGCRSPLLPAGKGVDHPFVWTGD